MTPNNLESLAETSLIRVLTKYGPITTIALAGCLFFAYLFTTTIQRIYAQVIDNNAKVDLYYSVDEQFHRQQREITQSLERYLQGICKGVNRNDPTAQQQYCNE